MTQKFDPDPQELIGEADPEIAALIAKCERVKKLTDFYLSKVGEEEGQHREKDQLGCRIWIKIGGHVKIC